MSILETANGLRKQLKLIQARISKAANEKIKITHELENIENKCAHDWNKAKLVKGTQDSYTKDCKICGIVKKSSGISIKF